MITLDIDNEYFTDEKIQEIKRLLITTTLPIKTIQTKVGHEYINNWSEKFKKLTGWSPTNYRMRYNDGKSNKSKMFVYSDLPLLKPNRSIIIDNSIQRVIFMAIIRGVTIHDSDGNTQELPMFGKEIQINPLQPKVSIGPYFINALGHNAQIVFTFITDHMSGTDFIFVTLSRGNNDILQLKLDGEIHTKP
jgi:hypothetical protein